MELLDVQFLTSQIMSQGFALKYAQWKMILMVIPQAGNALFNAQETLIILFLIIQQWDVWQNALHIQTFMQNLIVENVFTIVWGRQAHIQEVSLKIILGLALKNALLFLITIQITLLADVFSTVLDLLSLLLIIKQEDVWVFVLMFLIYMEI